MVLGAMATFNNKKRLLDIGAGTGILGLMVAQNHDKIAVHGIESNQKAAIDLKQNYASSPFPNSFTALEMDFLSLSGEKFDAFIVNPPFYVEGYLGADAELNDAKHVGSLDLSSLLDKMDALAEEGAECWMIWPFNSINLVHQTFFELPWSLKASIIINGKPGHPKRVVLQWAKTESEMPVVSLLTIRDEKGNYTEEYKALTLEFHGVKL